MEEFLIGAGLALLLALIAWSDSIRILHKDTLALEKDFSIKRDLDLRKIRLLIRNETALARRITTLNTLVYSSKIDKRQDIDIINQLINLDKDRRKLERSYRIKYALIIILTNLFFASGITNYFINDKSKLSLYIARINVEFIPIIICILFIYVILFYILHLNKTENKYKEKLNALLDII